MSCLLLSWHASSRECVFFVKQKTAYELRISDWSSDVCSSDLCDRGGQVTYHGPGQVMAYCLVDLRRMKLFVKEYVALLEDVIIQVLGDLDLAGACRKAGAPGVYVPVSHLLPQYRMAPRPDDDGQAKIAALGIKIRKGCAYHGLALNVDMNLAPFQGINPCGYEGLQTVDLRSCGVQATVAEAGDLLARRLLHAFHQGYPAGQQTQQFY